MFRKASWFLVVAAGSLCAPAMAQFVIGGSVSTPGPATGYSYSGRPMTAEQGLDNQRRQSNFLRAMSRYAPWGSISEGRVVFAGPRGASVDPARQAILDQLTAMYQDAEAYGRWAMDPSASAQPPALRPAESLDAAWARAGAMVASAPAGKGAMCATSTVFKGADGGYYTLDGRRLSVKPYSPPAQTNAQTRPAYAPPAANQPSPFVIGGSVSGQPAAAASGGTWADGIRQFIRSVPWTGNVEADRASTVSVYNMAVASRWTASDVGTAMGFTPEAVNAHLAQYGLPPLPR